jgi:ABC-type multidrug transport system fused ATPase/permease subunit
MSRIDMILKADVAIKDKPNAIENIQLKENILYKNVSFRYADEYVLKNIDPCCPKRKNCGFGRTIGFRKNQPWSIYYPAFTILRKVKSASMK